MSSLRKSPCNHTHTLFSNAQRKQRTRNVKCSDKLKMKQNECVFSEKVLQCRLHLILKTSLDVKFTARKKNTRGSSPLKFGKKIHAIKKHARTMLCWKKNDAKKKRSMQLEWFRWTWMHEIIKHPKSSLDEDFHRKQNYVRNLSIT